MAFSRTRRRRRRRRKRWKVNLLTYWLMPQVKVNSAFPSLYCVSKFVPNPQLPSYPRHIWDKIFWLSTALRASNFRSNNNIAAPQATMRASFPKEPHNILINFFSQNSQSIAEMHISDISSQTFVRVLSHRSPSEDNGCHCTNSHQLSLPMYT